jgi:hypothetical protein
MNDDGSLLSLAKKTGMCPKDAGTGPCDCATGEWIKRLRERLESNRAH